METAFHSINQIFHPWNLSFLKILSILFHFPFYLPFHLPSHFIAWQKQSQLKRLFIDFSVSKYLYWNGRVMLYCVLQLHDSSKSVFDFIFFDLNYRETISYGLKTNIVLIVNVCLFLTKPSQAWNILDEFNYQVCLVSLHNYVQ